MLAASTCKVLQDIGLSQLNVDGTIFFDKGLYIGVYVDELIIIGEPASIKDFKDKLSQFFKFITSSVPEFLGLDFIIDSNATHIRSKSKIDSLLEEHDIKKSTSTPIT